MEIQLSPLVQEESESSEKLNAIHDLLEDTFIAHTSISFSQVLWPKAQECTVIYICIYPCILLYSVCFHLTDDKDRKIIETTVITSRVGTHSYCRPCHNKG